MCILNYFHNRIGGSAFLVLVAYVGWRLSRYRRKYHDERAKTKDLREQMEEMEVAGTATTRGDEDVIMTVNPLHSALTQQLQVFNFFFKYVFHAN